MKNYSEKIVTIAFAIAIKYTMKGLVKSIFLIPFFCIDAINFFLNQLPKYIVFGYFIKKQSLTDRLLNW